MLSSNIVIENTVIDIDMLSLPERVTFSVYLNKETGYLSILGTRNPRTGKLSSIHSLNISKEFNQPIIIPDNLTYLTIDGEFNQPIILPDSLKYLNIKGEFNQPIIIPDNLKYLTISEEFNQY